MEYEPLPIFSSDFPKVVIPLIENAVNTIEIVVFDWRFYNRAKINTVSLFNEAIFRAVERGVKVRCLVQNQRVVDRLKQAGCEARSIHTKRILHTKLLIIDKTRIILGSHNYTQSAFDSNYEASIFIVLKDEKNALVQYFNNLWGL
jgi:phosphatidylserine/phosphatidylglycerophosphate/cardiolipin synthase-like enzyme